MTQNYLINAVKMPWYFMSCNSTLTWSGLVKIYRSLSTRHKAELHAADIHKVGNIPVYNSFVVSISE